MNINKKQIEFWRVQAVEGAYYTLKSPYGEIQDFLKIETSDIMEYDDVVAIGCVNGVRHIIKKVSEQISQQEVKSLIADFYNYPIE